MSTDRSRSWDHSPVRLPWFARTVVIVVACGASLAVAKVEPGGKRGRRLCQMSPRRSGHLRQWASPAGPCSLSNLGSLAAERAVDLAQTPDGFLYAATGDAGKVFPPRSQGGRRPGPLPTIPRTRRSWRWRYFPTGPFTPALVRTDRWSI